MNIHRLESADLKGKIVAVRLDLNVPVKEGKIAEKTRIIESVPTLKYLLKKEVKQIHIFSHLGRPKGVKDPSFSLKVVQPELEKALGEEVEFRENLKAGSSSIQLHENIRFYPGEKTNDPDFIKKILNLGLEVFVNDGFAVSHRAHASVVGLGSFLPSFAGLLLEKEIENLSPFLNKQKTPGLTVVVGGAKISTKINVLKQFCEVAENIIIGGALANTFLAAKGHDVGESFCEPDQVPIAKDILALAEEKKVNFILPSDAAIAENPDEKAQNVEVNMVSGTLKIFDMGKQTIKHYTKILQNSQIIIWNGPLGFFEKPNFSAGTKEILKVIASQKSAKTILGGGDTLEALKKFGVDRSAFSHVSTGGGAMLEFLEGKELPGIEMVKE